MTPLELVIRATDQASAVVNGFQKNAEDAFKDVAAAAGDAGAVMGGALTGGATIAAAAILSVGAAGVAAAEGILKMSEAVGAASDKLTTLSDRTGVGVHDLQELQFAGSTVGVSLDQAANAFKLMEKNITEGSGVFQRLGLNLKELRDNSPIDAFKEVATAIANLGDPMQQDAAAMEAFGRSGAVLLPLIKSDLGAAADEAERLGIVIGDKGVSAANQFHDETVKLGAAWQAVQDQFAAAILESGALQDATEALKTIIGDLASFLRDNKDVISAVFSSAASEAKELASWIPTIRTGMEGLARIAGLWNDDLQAALPLIQQATAALGNYYAQKAAIMGGGAAATTGAGVSFMSQKDIDAAKKLKDQIEADQKTIAAAMQEAQQSASKATQKIAAEDSKAEDNRLKNFLSNREAQLKGAIAANKEEEKSDNEKYQNWLDQLHQALINAQEAAAKQKALWQDASHGIQDFGNALQALAGNGESAMGKLGMAIAGVGKAIGDLMSAKDTAGKIGAVASGIGSIGAGLFGSDTAMGGFLGGAGSGAAMGASVGALFGGVGAVPGAVIGGVVGGIMGIFSAAAKAKAEVEQLHQTINQTFGSMADAKEQADQLGLHLDAAFDSNDPKKLSAAVKELSDAEAAHKKILDGLDTAMTGLNLHAQGFNEELASGIANQRELGFLGAEAWGEFAMELKETGDLIGTLSKMGPTLDALAAGEAKLGHSAGGAVDKLLELRNVITTNADIADSIAGITQELKGLADAGMLTDGLLQTMGADLVEQNDALLKRGVTQADAFAIEQPALQQIWEAHVKNGQAIDAETQALLDQAEAQGIVGAQFESVNQKILDVLLAINDALGGVAMGWNNVGNAAAQAGNKAGGAMHNMPGGGGYDDGGGSYQPHGPQGSYASGTPFVPFDMTARIHRGEMIVPASQNPNNRASGGSGGGSARLGGGSVQQFVVPLVVGGAQWGQAVFHTVDGQLRTGAHSTTLVTALAHKGIKPGG